MMGFLKLSDKVEDDNRKKLFIQILGGHASGKSGLVSGLIKEFGNSINPIGPYNPSKTTNGILTGGMDCMKLKALERFELIKDSFLSNKPVVICEGMMLIYFDSFVSQYKKLMENKNRDVYIVLLNCEFEEILKRVEFRSKGKKLDDPRRERLLGKHKTSISTYNKALEMGCYNYLTLDTSNNNFKEPLEILKKLIKEYI